MNHFAKPVLTDLSSCRNDRIIKKWYKTCASQRKYLLENKYLGVFKRISTYFKHTGVGLKYIWKYTNSQTHVKKLKFHNYDHSPHTLTRSAGETWAPLTIFFDLSLPWPAYTTHISARYTHIRTAIARLKQCDTCHLNLCCLIAVMSDWCL